MIDLLYSGCARGNFSAAPVDCVYGHEHSQMSRSCGAASLANVNIIVRSIASAAAVGGRDYISWRHLWNKND